MSTKISDIKKQLEQLEARKEKLNQQAKVLTRKNATQLKILIGVHLSKLAETDKDAKEVHQRVIAIIQAEKPELF
jgi:hypothetical protein